MLYSCPFRAHVISASNTSHIINVFIDLIYKCARQPLNFIKVLFFLCKSYARLLVTFKPQHDKLSLINLKVNQFINWRVNEINQVWSCITLPISSLKQLSSLAF